MNSRRLLHAVVLLVLGGLWILLTGACSQEMVKSMGGKGVLQLELMVTLPGCLLVLAGLARLLSRQILAAVVLGYAALLSVSWSAAVLTGNDGHPRAMWVLLAVFNVPPLLLGCWGLALLLKRGDD